MVYLRRQPVASVRPLGGKNELLKEKVYFHHSGGPEREPTETTKQMSGFISGI